MIHATRWTVGTVLVAGLLGGCAYNPAREADREQQASIDLQRAGARQAAQAAQARSDNLNRSARCGDFLECVFTALLSIEKGK
ncbi:hypothetical protein CDN99_11960 [Roseateles aquatilis]|uniref:Uncharacterized protein n=1 Tax=Roseateles aquatilis TaxID=431061 RepID=A0A246JE50_9BURK|nr:hypothetical protein [Roseateles aquatilis]OWQ90869.1 hypothetical protein CDN99_11960 [Roseateles aquatilis]